MTPATLEVLHATARSVQFAGGFLVVGAAVQRWAVLPIASRTVPDLAASTQTLVNRAARWGMLGAVLLLLATFGRLWLQGSALIDPGEPLTGELLRYVVVETAWGRGWLAQLLAATLAGLAFLVAWGYGRLGWAMALVGASAVAFAAPLTGHATGSAEAGALGYPLDLLHYLGGGAWIGTLAVLAASALWSALPPNGADRHRFIRALVLAFSSVALVAGLVAMAAGVVLAWRYLDGSITALVSSRYGQTLLLKLAALAGVAGVGVWNWRVVSPRLGSPEATGQVARTSALELAFSVILLVITSVLVSLPMPGDEP